jgi:hypothetical protein
VDGVTVQQYYASEAFELPSVVFDVATERAEPVEVRFVVTDIEARQVGFHPRFRSDAWTISDGRLVFEATVGPDETVRTLYALDTDDQEIFEHAMERLRIEQVGPPTGVVHRSTWSSVTPSPTSSARQLRHPRRSRHRSRNPPPTAPRVARGRRQRQATEVNCSSHREASGMTRARSGNGHGAPTSG